MIAAIGVRSSNKQTIECLQRYTCGNNDQCPPQYWCHVGASVEFNACCYGADNPCMQEMRPGSGPFALARWYYDRDRARCMQFTYLGLFGTANNFLTRQQCEQACTGVQFCARKAQRNISAFAAVFEPQQVCQTEMLPSRACVSNEDCPVSFWCHIGISQADNRCCRVFGALCIVNVYIDTDCRHATMSTVDGCGHWRRRAKTLVYGSGGGCMRHVQTVHLSRPLRQSEQLSHTRRVRGELLT